MVGAAHLFCILIVCVHQGHPGSGKLSSILAAGTQFEGNPFVMNMSSFHLDIAVFSSFLQTFSSSAQ